MKDFWKKLDEAFAYIFKKKEQREKKPQPKKAK